jgi:hypothetical protein
VIADVHAVRGEIDKAFEWLKQAYTQRDAELAELKHGLNFRSLLDDPRWGDFLKKIGLGD